MVHGNEAHYGSDLLVINIMFGFAIIKIWNPCLFTHANGHHVLMLFFSQRLGFLFTYFVIFLHCLRCPSDLLTLNIHVKITNSIFSAFEGHSGQRMLLEVSHIFYNVTWI